MRHSPIKVQNTRHEGVGVWAMESRPADGVSCAMIGGLGITLKKGRFRIGVDDDVGLLTPTGLIHPAVSTKMVWTLVVVRKLAAAGRIVNVTRLC